MGEVIKFTGDLAPVEGADYQTVVVSSMENLTPEQNTVAGPEDHVSVSVSLDGVEIYFPNGKPVAEGEGWVKYLYIPISAWRDSD